MAKRQVWLGAIGAAAVAALYAAYPYYTLHRLGAALEAGDRLALEQLVDWPSLREGVKSDLNALATRALAEHAGPGGDPDEALEAGIAAILAPMVVERAVEAYVTPAGIAELMRREERIGAPGEDEAAASHDWRFEVHGATFAGPATFHFEFSNPDDPQPGPAIGIMELHGLSWRLTRLILPIEQLVLPQG